MITSNDIISTTSEDTNMNSPNNTPESYEETAQNQDHYQKSNTPFARRLKEAMINAGYHSDRSATGVNLQKLVEITGHSIQICRKYLRGDALPDIKKILEIATQLQVTPSWLLFGEGSLISKTDPQIIISRKLLFTLLTHAHDLYTTSRDSNNIANHLLSLIDDISQLDIDEEKAIKVMQLSLTSISNLFKN